MWLVCLPTAGRFSGRCDRPPQRNFPRPAVEPRLHGEQPIDIGGTIGPALSQTDQELSQLECVGGIGKAVVSQLRLDRSGQERIIFVEGAGLARARGQLHRKMPAGGIGLRSGPLNIEAGGIVQLIAETCKESALTISILRGAEGGK